MAKQLFRGLNVDTNQFQDDGSGNLQAKTNAANALAELDGNGKLPTSLLPGLAISEVHVVADITARDALTVEKGDVAKVTDSGDGTAKTYIYDGSAWIEFVAADTGNNTKVETLTLDGDDITNKTVTLSETPLVAGEVAISVKGIGDQFYSDDFTVSGTTVSWSGLGMDSLSLEAGDKVRAVYEYAG